MSMSKIAVGRYNEQHAFGMSTTPLTRPSIGAAPSSTVGLRAGLPELVEVGDGVETGVAVCNGGVVVQLRISVVLDADTDERDEFGVARFDVAGHEDRIRCHAVRFHTALDQVDVKVDEAAHLDGAAKGDLAVALAEVQIATGEERAGHMHGVEHP
jgi:hypothetical protein